MREAGYLSLSAAGMSLTRVSSMSRAAASVLGRGEDGDAGGVWRRRGCGAGVFCSARLWGWWAGLMYPIMYSSSAVLADLGTK